MSKNHLGFGIVDLAFTRACLRFALSAMVLLLSYPALAETAPKPAEITFDEYRATIERTTAAVPRIKDSPAEAIALWKSLPDGYSISANGTKYAVDVKPLKKAIAEYNVAPPERKKLLFTSIESALAEMRGAAVEFSVASDVGAEHKRLQDILARREFNRVRGPTILEIWWDKLTSWLGRVLARIFSRVPSAETGYRIFVWVLVAIAACILAIWLKRVAGRRSPEFTREIIPFAPSERSWRLWLADARRSAESGNWRDAVHLAYWAGISNLEENGAWIPDRARTPREYLRLLAAANVARPVLQQLTRKFELIWYGERPAEAADFQQTLEFLERLGCR